METIGKSQPPEHGAREEDAIRLQEPQPLDNTYYSRSQKVGTSIYSCP